MRTLFLTTFCLAWIAAVNVLPAADAATEFDQANKLYEGGKFREAAEGYRKILATGNTSTPLLFNLGNAQFKAGQIGQAIAAYRQAAEFSPRDADLNANLQFVRGRVTGPTMKPNWLQRSVESLTANEWTLLAAVPVWLWLGLLAVRQLKPALRQPLRTATLTTAIASLLACGALAVALNYRLNEKTVVVTTRDAVARFGPFAESQSAFTANDGAELRLIDAKDDWVQVTDGGKTFGWLKTNAVIVLN